LRSFQERIQAVHAEWAAETCGLAVEEVVQLARDYGTAKPAAIRLNYGMQRHAGAAWRARTIACLPALHRRLARSGRRDPADDGRQLQIRPRHARASRSHAAQFIRRASARRQSLEAGDVLTAAERPVRAVIVYNNNRSPSARIRTACCRASRAKTCSAW
jgi:anaerobic selenocysteine-containing dehydrogenase